MISTQPKFAAGTCLAGVAGSSEGGPRGCGEGEGRGDQLPQEPLKCQGAPDPGPAAPHVLGRHWNPGTPRGAESRFLFSVVVVGGAESRIP